ncbi:MAG TPA: hypothetical protein VHF22_13570, partial [Planctomycetota bacterium]|nr:hypothetical protein [Planctomycetota bacterium]
AEDVAGGGVEVRIDARRLPVDPQLRAAAAPRARAIYEGVGPEAGELSSLTITALVAQKGAPIELSVDAALAGVAIRPPRAPLPLTGLTGVVHLTPTALALDGVAGELVGAPLRAAGEIALVPGAGTSTATLTVRGLELDDRLARELPPGLAKVFARVRPQGRLDLETRLLGAGMALEPAVSGRLEGGAFLLDFFPLAATTLTAEIRADAREVRIERLRGKIGEGRLEGEGRIELASGPAAEAGEGLAGARFSARVADLPLDARLVDAFPERLRKTLEDLGLGGRATLDLRGAFDPAARPGGLLSYAAEVGLARAKLDVGLALTDIEGTIDAHGSWPLEARPAPDIEGGFRVRHALWKEQDLERFSGRFASGPELFEVKEIRGELLGGVVEGEFYAFGESPRMYGAELSLAGGQLERARVHYGQRKAAGLVEGRLTLAGSPAEGGVEASLKGEGALRVKDGRLYELPTFAGIFSVLSGELPAKPVFDDARVDLALDGKRLLVERAEFSSPVLSLFGTGTIVDGQADLRVVPEIGRPWFNRIPIFGTLWGTLKGNLFLELEVKGSLDDPAVVARPVKMLYEPALWFFQRRRAAEGKGAREEQ